MTTNTDPRAAGSLDAQKVWRYIRSFTKSIDEQAEHEMSKGESVPSVANDVYHKPNSLEHVHAGEPTSASGQDASEFAGRHRDEAKQIGGSEAAEAISKLLERQERTEKALRRFFKAVDWDAHGMDDEDEESEKSDSEDEDEVDKSMPSMSVPQLMRTVSSRGNQEGFRIPPSFAKANSDSLADRIEKGIEHMSIPHQILAKSLLCQLHAVKDGSLAEPFFQDRLHDAPGEVQVLFREFGRDRIVKSWGW